MRLAHKLIAPLFEIKINYADWRDNPQIMEVISQFEIASKKMEEELINDHKTSVNLLKFSTPYLFEIINKKSQQESESEIWKKFTFPKEIDGKYKAMYHYLHIMKYLDFKDGCSELVLTDAARAENFKAFPAGL